MSVTHALRAKAIVTHGTQQKSKPLVIDASLVKCIEILHARLESWAHHYEAIMKEDAVATLAVSMSDVNNTMIALKDVWLVEATNTLLELAYTELTERTSALESKTPRFSHLITRTKYSARLAKAQLLGNSYRAVLPTHIAQVYELTASISAAYKSMSSKLKLPDVGLAASAADAAVECGRQTMAVIAAVNVLENMQGAEARDAAHTILESGHDLPDSLSAKLKTLADA